MQEDLFDENEQDLFDETHDNDDLFPEFNPPTTMEKNNEYKEAECKENRE